jgi:hypothetical protein
MGLDDPNHVESAREIRCNAQRFYGALNDQNLHRHDPDRATFSAYCNAADNASISSRPGQTK